MIRILLCCGGGFSSSAQTVRAQKEIIEKGLQDELAVEFAPADVGVRNFEGFDVIFLCPHRKYRVKEYNEKHGITPQTINKSIREAISVTKVENIQEEYNISKDETIEDIITKLTDEMLKHASLMEFEKAAELRDKIKELEKLI